MSLLETLVFGRARKFLTAIDSKSHCITKGLNDFFPYKRKQREKSDCFIFKLS